MVVKVSVTNRDVFFVVILISGSRFSCFLSIALTKEISEVLEKWTLAIQMLAQIVQHWLVTWRTKQF